VSPVRLSARCSPKQQQQQNVMGGGGGAGVGGGGGMGQNVGGESALSQLGGRLRAFCAA
jgi:hypothetical protein